MAEFDIINHEGRIYLKEELRKILNTPKLKGFVNYKTVTLCPEDADLKEVRESLKVILKDIDLRIKKMEGK